MLCLAVCTEQQPTPPAPSPPPTFYARSEASAEDSLCVLPHCHFSLRQDSPFWADGLASVACPNIAQGILLLQTMQAPISLLSGITVCSLVHYLCWEWTPFIKEPSRSCSIGEGIHSEHLRTFHPQGAVSVCLGHHSAAALPPNTSWFQACHEFPPWVRGPCPLEVIDASLCGELTTYSTGCVLCKGGRRGS